MIQNVNFHTCIKAEDKLWFITIDGYFMNYDLKLDKVKVIAPENLKELYFGQIVDKMFFYKGCIYFVEQDGSLLYEYDIKENYCYYYKLPKIEMVNWESFAGIYRIDDSIYFFGKKSNVIYDFNVVNKRINQFKIDSDILLKNSVIIGDNIYFAGDKEVIIFNLKEKKYISRYMVDVSIRYIFAYKNEIYLLSEQNDLYLYDTELKIKSVVYKKNKMQTIGRIVITENYMFVFPLTTGYILTINKKDGNIEKIVEPLDMIYNDIKWAKYYGNCEDKDTIWMANRMSNYTVFINKHDESIHFKKIINNSVKEKIPYLRKKPVLNQDDMSLDEFLTLCIE